MKEACRNVDVKPGTIVDAGRKKFALFGIKDPAAV